MYNITTRIGGNDGPLVAVDEVTVTVTIPITGKCRVELAGFRKGNYSYGFAFEHLAELEAHEVGPRILEIAGVEAKGVDPEPQLERVLDCLAGAFAGYCRDFPDPDHLPEAWVDEAQELLGPKRARALYSEAAAWPSISVMGAAAAFELAARWLEFNTGPFDASAAQRLREAAAGKRDGLPRVAIVPLPPREKWPEGMNTESPNEGPCVQFDGWMRAPGRVRDIAAALLAAADEAERDATEKGSGQ